MGSADKPEPKSNEMDASHDIQWTALDNLDVQLLDQGTQVEIVWSGGNGPHHGRIVFDHRSEPYFVAEEMYAEAMERDDPTTHPMWFYNPLGIFGELPLTELRKVES